MKYTKLLISLVLFSLCIYTNAQETYSKAGLSSTTAQTETIAVYGVANPGLFQNGNVSELNLMKSFRGESVWSLKKFNVSSNTTVLKLRLFGGVKSGAITITILKPDGKVFKIIDIDAASDVNFEHTFDLKKNPSEYIGDWQIKIQTDKADGSYNFRIYSIAGSDNNQ